MTNGTQLPKVIEHPISHDPAKVAEKTGLDPKQVGGKKGYRLPDKEETDLVNVIRTGYLRVLNAGNDTPELKHIIGSSKKSMVKEALRDAVAKGNAYGKLLIPTLDGKKSPYWTLLESLLRKPSDYGFDDIPGIRDDVELESTGKDAPALPQV